ncbi:DUF6236 family protein [Streptomyces prunicolor]|uniref:DUF6236 family protein n=1 Tax=Streptomyces prunicolor TaxID=67348 RepID=UPI0033EBCAB9
MLQQIGLYYPYIHVRDEQWLKVAALYWPKLARIMPAGYPVADSPTARELAEGLDFLVPVDPAQTADAVAPLFLEAIEGHATALRDRYGGPFNAESFAPWPWAPDDVEPRPPVAVPARPRVAGMHMAEVSPALRSALLGASLAQPTHQTRFRHYDGAVFLAMDAGLAWVYKCVFVSILARQGRLTPTTDQSAAHLAADSWDADRVIAALLPSNSTLQAPQDPTTTMGMLAIRIVIPENLADIPTRKIIELRQQHRSEFEAFSTAITETTASLQAELAEVTLPEARAQYLQLEVDRRFAAPLEDLRRAMKAVGVETAFSAANLKFELPAIATTVAGGALAGSPTIGTTLGAAFAIASIRRNAGQQRQAVLAASPAAYLLSIERGLEPRSLLRRLAGLLPGLPC